MRLGLSVGWWEPGKPRPPVIDTVLFSVTHCDGQMVPFTIVTDDILTRLCASLLKIRALLFRRDSISFDSRIQGILNFWPPRTPS